MRKSLVACVLGVVLAAPGAASAAPSGSITDIRPVGDQLTATYTTSFDVCTEFGYCGFYAHAWQIPASEQCREDNKDDLTYVSDEVRTTSGTIVGSDTFSPLHDPVRICLYAAHSSREYLVAEAVYPPQTGTAPDPVAEEEPTPYVAMTIGEARSLVSDALAARYKGRFAKSTLTRACSRLSVRKVRCRVAWRKRSYSYRGTATLWYDAVDAAGDYETYTYATAVKRTRIKTSSPSGGGGGGTAPEPSQPSCNPNYSGVCLQLSGDVDCGEISATDFRSVGSDPFRLDGDGDGVACES